MTYRLTITKIEPNPEYDPEEAKRRNGLLYSDKYGVPRNLETQALMSDLTDEQFNAVRRACIEVVK